MVNKNVVVFILWNLLLTGLVVWLLVGRKSGPSSGEVATTGTDSTAVTPIVRDTVGLKTGRIAFFYMDSLKNRYELVKASADRVQGEGQRMQDNFKRQYDRAQARAQELMTKDHTYSTNAEKESDEQEYRKLQMDIQELQGRLQSSFDEMQAKALMEIVGELKGYLEEYNKTAGFDYVFSIENEGQIWVGNKGLNITEDLVQGLNARYRAKQTAPAPAKK
ncbi:MAG TPA: OmpH family outer membrane protein [Flavobacteriales bacterium]|jgi:outer membrane protein|nr:OmpH family outer membrane protein [Flavobacteriales bacterium]